MYKMRDSFADDKGKLWKKGFLETYEEVLSTPNLCAPLDCGVPSSDEPEPEPESMGGLQNVK